MLIRFGPFEADPVAGELRKAGRIVRVQEQPFKVLLALVERPGEVVTREELRARLWPSDAFGEFDQGLNTAINKLRDALGDSPSDPRFVETLPKRGYRFLHPLEPVPGPDVSVPLKPIAKGRKIAAAVLLGVVVGILIGTLWARRQTLIEVLPHRHFTLKFDAPLSATPDFRLVAIAPNGKNVALIDRETNNSIWVQDLDGVKPRRLQGTESAASVFWSPDSKMVGFTSPLGKVRKVGAGGGPVVTLVDHQAYVSGASWSTDGRSIVFASGTPSSLYVVDANGGTGKMLAEGGKSGGARWLSDPHFISSVEFGQKLLYSADRSLVLRDMASGATHTLGPGRNPAYSPSGYLMFQEGTTLWARRISLPQGKVEGDAVLVAHNANDPSVASDGTLVYRDLPAAQLVWRNRRGERLGTAGQPALAIFYPSLSPDGRRVAAEIREADTINIWAIDVERGTRVRLSSSSAAEIVPVWSPTGDRVAYGSYRSGNIDIFARHSDAEREELTIASGPLNQRPSDWTRDGRILYSIYPKKGIDLAYLKQGQNGQWQTIPLLETPANERSAKVSPDGRYIAYLSDESGRNEVYVREFINGGRKWPVSANGAVQIRWSRNGREIFYVEAGALMAAPVNLAGEFSAGAAIRLFSHPAFTGTEDPNYDVSPDGQRILLPERIAERDSAIHVVQNWMPEGEAKSTK